MPRLRRRYQHMILPLVCFTDGADSAVDTDADATRDADAALLRFRNIAITMPPLR